MLSEHDANRNPVTLKNYRSRDLYNVQYYEYVLEYIIEAANAGTCRNIAPTKLPILG